MSKVLVTETYLEDIADAIRSKNGSTDMYTPAEMASAISDISGGGTPTLQSKTVSYTPTTTAITDTITADSGYDGLEEVDITVNAVATGSATTPATSIAANPSISISNSGLITATVSVSKSVIPTISAGYISSGTAGTVTVSGSNTQQLTTQAAQTVTPSTSTQTVGAAGRYMTGAVTVNPIPSDYIIPSGSETKTENGTYDVTNLAELIVNVSGSSVKTATGTFTGNGSRQVTITCDFEPDFIYWTSDPGTSASSGTVAGMIAREMMASNRYRNNSTSNSANIQTPITAMNTGGSSYNFRATWSNNTVTLYCFSSNARSLFTNGRTYTYTFLKWT